MCSVLYTIAKKQKIAKNFIIPYDSKNQFYFWKTQSEVVLAELTIMILRTSDQIC